MHRATVWDPKHAQPMVPHCGTWSYPSLHVTGGRALIAYPYSYYDEDGIRIGGSRLKVLPLEWFYGGRDRFKESPVIDKVFEPPKP